MRKLFVVAPVVALTLAGSAAADPGTVTLDRQDAQSRVGGEISYLLPENGDATFLRFDIHGQYVTPSGFGFYAGVPIGFVDGEADSVTGIGNVDVGAIFIPRLASSNVSLVLHGGITLPTAGDELDDFIVNASTSYARVTDFILAIPEALALRVGVSPTFRSGQFFLRADGGVDISLSNTGETFDPVLRINAAAGIDLGKVSFSAELVNVIFTEDFDDDQVLNMLAIGIRGAAGNVRPYGAVVIPLDIDGLDAAFTAGIEGVIQ
jgi:hypothetical protein